MQPILEWAYHNIDPTAFTIPGLGFEVKWYGLSYMLTFVIAWLVLNRLRNGGYLRLAKDDVTSMIMYTIVGVFLGGRLGYMFFYTDYFYSSGAGSFFDDPGYLIGFSKDGFRGLEGLSFHGGLIGVMLSLVVFCYVRAGWQIRAKLKAGIELENPSAARRTRWKVLCAELFDACTLAAPIGIVLVRLANFVNGELYGRIIEDEASAPAWAMRFPTSPEGREAITHYIRTPEAYRIAEEALGTGASPASIDAKLNAAASLPVDPEIWSQISQQVALRHPSQLYQAFAEGLVLLVLAWVLRKRLPKRGMVGGVFLMGYALGRIPMEYFRQPDKQFDVGQEMSAWGSFLANMGLTQGQLLSFAMLAAGAILFYFTGRSKDPAMLRSADELSFKAVAMSDAEAGIPRPRA